MQPFITALKVFESDLCPGMLIYEFIERIIIESEVQVELIEESVNEVFRQMTETFCRAEKSKLIDQFKEAAESAKAKVQRYFDDKLGVYPALDFVKAVQFFHPKLSLYRFPISPKYLTMSSSCIGHSLDNFVPFVKPMIFWKTPRIVLFNSKIFGKECNQNCPKCLNLL